MMAITAGPTITTNVAGKINMTRGGIILAGIFAAISSARWRRFDTKRLRINTQCLADAGSEPVRLNQHGTKSFQVVHAGSASEVAESIGAAASHVHINIGKVEFIAEVRVRCPEFLTNTHEGLIQTQTCFDTDDSQIERVSQSQLDSFFPASDQSPKYKVRQRDADEQREH
jgi:hypothetical protein